MKSHQIAYLELSERGSGKSTRLRELAVRFADQGLPVVFVSFNAAHLPRHERIIDVHPDDAVTCRGLRPGEHTYFFDEFDLYETPAPIMEGAYYATSIERAPDVCRDVLIERLILAHQGYSLTFRRGADGASVFGGFVTERILKNVAPGEYVFDL